MRVVFMGTPHLAATILDKLADAQDVVGAYTRPDAVRGRGKKLVASPVKAVAQARGIPVFTPSTFADDGVVSELASLKPDVICVAAYGALLPRAVLDVPRFGCLNVHTSLLPRWRGAAPMQRAILEQDASAGVCIMRMEESLDTGPYCARIETELDGLYLAELEERLAELGAMALVDSLKQVQSAPLTWTEQGLSGVTYAAKIGKGELDLDPADPAALIAAKVRASSDAHPAHATVAGRDVTVERASAVRDEQALSLCEGLESGQALYAAKRFIIMAADGPVELENVKPHGKKSMDAKSFAAGVQGIKNTIVTWGRA